MVLRRDFSISLRFRVSVFPVFFRVPNRYFCLAAFCLTLPGNQFKKNKL